MTSVLSGVGLLAAAPLGLAIAAAIKLQDGGAVFFTQPRVGQGGVPFEGYKFRSMIVDADKGAVPVQAAEDDPRVTRLGKILRKTAMDELPQLWNIFKGDMSFVGPRALAVSEEELSGGSSVDLSSVPGYEARHAVIPGLTGVAQIYAARDVSRRHKFRLDRLYVEKQSFWLDVRLIVLSVLGSRFEVGGKCGRRSSERGAFRRHRHWRRSVRVDDRRGARAPRVRGGGARGACADPATRSIAAASWESRRSTGSTSPCLWCGTR